MNLRLVLGHVRERPVDRQVIAQRGVFGQARHAPRGDACALDGGDVVAVLATERGAGFLGGGEGIEAFVGPVEQHRLEGGHDERGVECLRVVHACGLHYAVERTGVDVHLAVVVARAEHVIEVDPAVEEAPRHVAHQGAQKGVGRNGVGARLALGRPVHLDEVFVADEGERAEIEALVAGGGVGCAGGDFAGGERGSGRRGVQHGHVVTPEGKGGAWVCAVYCRQMSAHFSTDSSPARV
ncbi:hypothetical protein FQZ97_774400 [compost metagenome]